MTIKMEQTECSKMSAYRIQTPGNYIEESIQNSEHGKSLKSRIQEGEMDSRLRFESATSEIQSRTVTFGCIVW